MHVVASPAWSIRPQRAVPSVTPSPAPVTHCVTHLAESSSPIVGAYTMAEAPLWERLAQTTPNEIRVNSITCTGGLSGFAQRNAVAALMILPAVTGAMMGGPLGWSMTAVSTGLMVFASGAGPTLLEKARSFGSPEPDVTRVERSNVKHPKAELVKTALDQNIARFPGMQIVYLSGHGDREQIALMPFREVGPAVEGSDVVVLDACETAQLEGMAHLAGHTKVVVGSTHSMIGWGLPVTYLLDHQLPDEPRALGALIVHNNAEKPRARSMVAMDMEVFENRLLPALDRLGKELSGRLDQGHKDEIIQALRDSQFVGSRFSSRVDLGSLLENLGKRLPDCAAASEAVQAWEATRIAQDGTAGMTVNLVAGREAEGVPKGWTTFLSKLNRRMRPFW